MSKKIVSMLLICLVLLETGNFISAQEAKVASTFSSSDPKTMTENEAVIIRAVLECAQVCTDEKCGGRLDCLDQCKGECDIMKLGPRVARMSRSFLFSCVKDCANKTCPDKMDDENCLLACAKGECNAHTTPGVNALLLLQCLSECETRNCPGKQDDLECADVCVNDVCKSYNVDEDAGDKTMSGDFAHGLVENCIHDCVQQNCKGNMNDAQCKEKCQQGECSLKNKPQTQAALLPECMLHCIETNCKGNRTINSALRSAKMATARTCKLELL